MFKIINEKMLNFKINLKLVTEINQYNLKSKNIYFYIELGKKFINIKNITKKLNDNNN